MPSQPTCHHVHANGALCQSPPLRNRKYCHFHLDQIGRRLRAARARARHQPARLQAPLLEDPFAIQVALMQVYDALAHGEIDAPRGRVLMGLLRLAAGNLQTMRDWEHEPLFVACEGEQEITEWPSFEQENELPEGFDLSLDPEVAFPPPEETPGAPHIPGVGICGNDDVLRAKIRHALGEAEAYHPGVTADNVELMDIYQRDGQEAADKFADQLVRNDRRRERRRQRAHYEELARHHNIKQAARELFEYALRTGVLKPNMTSEEAWQTLRGMEDETLRKPPQTEAVIGEMKASAAWA